MDIRDLLAAHVAISVSVTNNGVSGEVIATTVADMSDGISVDGEHHRTSRIEVGADHVLTVRAIMKSAIATDQSIPTESLEIDVVATVHHRIRITECSGEDIRDGIGISPRTVGPVTGLEGDTDIRRQFSDRRP